MERKSQNILLLESLGYSEIASLAQTNEKFNRALGTIYGAFIGDALGCTWEFRNPKLIKRQIASEMNGGGIFSLQPGQVTDDSQLALQLGYGLMQYDGNLNQQNIDILSKKIALNYVQWLKSKPFDIGQTCSTAFEAISLIDQTLPPKQFIQQVKIKLSALNLQSQSNGSLMRITPIAIFFAFFEQQQSKLLCEKLLDSIQIINQMKFALHIATKLQSLLAKCGQNYSKKLINRNEIQTKKIYDDFAKRIQYYPDLQKWFKEDIPKAQQNIGWGRIAWTQGIKHLKQSTINPDLNFKEIMIQVLLKGGDTDTNACIVGGLVGSIIGFKKLPQIYISTLLNFKFGCCDTKKRNYRHQKYLPRNGLSIVYQMYKTYEKYVNKLKK